jgi:NAD+ synthetase
LSGGIDSALVAALAVDALGAERVMGVTLPSTVTSRETWGDAQELAARLGIECPSIAIEPMVRSFREAMSAEGAGYERVQAGPGGTAAENLQARIRGAVVMTLSNQYSRLVLATSNFSESMTGYATLYGDMCGGLAPIARVPKTTVFALAKWRNTRGEVIPPSTIARPPSAELRPGQLDSDSLPPYPVLDALLEAHVQGRASRAELLARGLGSEAEVERTVRLVRLSEYKRHQAALALDVDPYRRGMMPVSHKFGF